MLIYFIERPHVSLYSNMKLEDAAIWISYCFHIILSRLTILRQVLTPLLFPSRSPANWSGRRTFRSAVSCGAFLSAKPSQNVWHVADPPCLWNSGDFSSQSAVTSKNKFTTRQRDAFSPNLYILTDTTFDKSLFMPGVIVQVPSFFSPMLGSATACINDVLQLGICPENEDWTAMNPLISCHMIHMLTSACAPLSVSAARPVTAPESWTSRCPQPRKMRASLEQVLVRLKTSRVLQTAVRMSNAWVKDWRPCSRNAWRDRESKMKERNQPLQLPRSSLGAPRYVLVAEHTVCCLEEHDFATSSIDFVYRCFLINTFCNWNTTEAGQLCSSWLLSCQWIALPSLMHG